MNPLSTASSLQVRFAALSLALVCAAPAWMPAGAMAQAQTRAGAAVPAATDDETSRAEVEQYVKELNGLITKKEENATSLINQIRAGDKAIQDAVTKILSLLKEAEDSARTRTKVAKLKADTVANLGRAAQAYARKRNEIAAQLSTATNPYTREDLFKARGAFDERISQWVDAAVGLALSMETDEGNEKYIKGPNVVTGRYGIGVQETHRNPDYDQKKREGGVRSKLTESLGDGLEASRKRLVEEERRAAGALQEQGLTEERKNEIAAERERLAALIAERTAQLQQVRDGEAEGASAAQGENGSQVVENAKQFASLEEIVQVTAAGARKQFARILNDYQDLSTERASLAELKSKLDKAEEWLKTHPASGQ
ncbi:MAG: hypothetical protein EOP86_08535 [Verrucomicrobiaceae bacterium]|nr:MAG: hypothetical protein EOP86_08535 [Verrucomicrobiaceae bacterium]